MDDAGHEIEAAQLKLIVGLGNPGRKYEGTRHNVGYEIVAEVARREGDPQPKSNFEGELVEVRLNGARCLLLAPATYMNRSGRSVAKARDFYKLPPENILVVCDDFNLPLAKLRIRPAGSAGGQKGLADILRALGTEAVPRLRIGVGPVPDRWDPIDFVLSKFKKDEKPEIQEAVCRAADAVRVWAVEGIEVCMNQFNTTPPSP